MNEKLNRLKDAHIEFELSRYSDSEIHSTVREELELVYVLIKGKKISEIFSNFRKEPLIGFLSSVLEHAEFRLNTDQAILLHNELIRTFQKSEVKVSDLPGEMAFEKAIYMLSHAENFRTNVVRSITGHPLFSHLLGEILFRGISDFVKNTTEASMIIPGAGALLKLGSNLFGQASAPAETFIKGFIKQNIQKTVKQTENYLLKALTPELLTQSGKELYDELKDVEIHSMLSAFDNEDIALSLPALESLLDRIAQSSAFDRLLADLLNNVVEVKADIRIEELVSKDSILMNKLNDVVVEIYRNARESGILKELYEVKYNAFYQSDHAKKIFNDITESN